MNRVPKWHIFGASILVLQLAALTACGGPAFEAANPSGITFGDPLSNPGGDYVDPSPSPNSNVLKNAGFEKGIDEWEDWGSSNLLTSNTHAGARGIRIGPSAGGMGQEVIYRLKAGASYQLRAYAKLGSSSDDAQLGIRFFDAGNATLGDVKTKVTSTSYQLITVNVTVPYGVSSAKVYMMKNNSSSTYADFDDFTMLMQGDPPTPSTLPAIANPSGLSPMGLSGAWKMVFNDSFDESLNSSVWSTGLWFNSTINSELQAYRPENAVISGGALNLRAENRSSVTTWGEAMNYASAAVNTRNKLTFTFGAVEARIRAPKGRGLMPLFQLLPNMKRSPPEINIFQMLGHQTTVADYSFKYFDYDGIGRMLLGSAMGSDFSADYHTYTLEWAPKSFRFLVDGVQKGSYSGESVLRDPAFLVLSLAIGGNEPGSPNSTTAFPQSYSIDYVRIWQRP